MKKMYRNRTAGDEKYSSQARLARYAATLAVQIVSFGQIPSEAESREFAAIERGLFLIHEGVDRPLADAEIRIINNVLDAGLSSKDPRRPGAAAEYNDEGGEMLPTSEAFVARLKESRGPLTTMKTVLALRVSRRERERSVIAKVRRQVTRTVREAEKNLADAARFRAEINARGPA